MATDSLRFSYRPIPNHGLGGKDHDMTDVKEYLYQERLKELQDSGRSFVEEQNGFLIEGKYKIGKLRNRWTVKGRENKWYWFKTLDQLFEKVGI